MGTDLTLAAPFNLEGLFLFYLISAAIPVLYRSEHTQMNFNSRPTCRYFFHQELFDNMLLNMNCTEFQQIKWRV